MAPNAYEDARAERIASNRKKMEELGLMKASSAFDTFRSVKLPPTAPKAPKLNFVKKASVKKNRPEPRRSGRLTGSEVCYGEIDERDRLVLPSQPLAGSKPSEVAMLEDPEALIDLMENSRHISVPEEASQEVWQAMQEVRCNSKGRGTLYDKTVGITCHFCRQKKLCGEENCPRCSARDVDKECIGKTNCSRCQSATGMFCRSCLELRYGQDLDEVRRQQEEWLCPHCYEEEHPDAGWICNSSICMTRRGLKPTGIAIYDARKAGFKSVAHLLQDRICKRKGLNNGGSSSQDEEEGGGSEDGQDSQGGSSARNNNAGTAIAGTTATTATTTAAAAPKAGTSRRDKKDANADATTAAAVEEEEDGEGEALGARLRKLRAARKQQPAAAGPDTQAAAAGAPKEAAAPKAGEEGAAEEAVAVEAPAAQRGGRRTRAQQEKEEAGNEQEVSSPAQPSKRRSTRLTA